MSTSRDVARLAGVSQPTVSRALRDDPKVAEATKQRVRDAAAALGYATNAIGRALSVGHSTRVGLVVTGLENQFYVHVIAPMHDELERMGYELALITERSETSPIAEHLVGHGLCGVVLATTTTDSVVPTRLHDRGLPFVYFNRVAAQVPADSVTVDPEQGLRELLSDVTRRGHTRIGAIFGPADTSTGQQREQATRAILDEFGLTLAHRNVLHGPYDFETGFQGLHRLLDLPAPPTLVLCGNDVVAIGALNAAAERGVAVPRELSLAGFDDLPSSSWALVRLSTVAYDLDAMSRAAARLIVARVEHPGAELTQTVFPTHYVPRGTIGPPRAAG